MLKLSPSLFILFITALALNACSRGDTPHQQAIVDISTPNDFLLYVNKQVNLPVGKYTIIAATASPGQSDNFTVDITKDDSSTSQLSGNWTNSGGQDETHNGNKAFELTLNQAGGINISLTSSVDNYLYLLDRSGKIIAEDNNSGDASNALIQIDKSRINNAAWTAAYYSAIDPNNERDTLNKFINKNGFGQADETRIVFRDTKDLGYGRIMVFREGNNGCMAAYVKNYQVNIIEGLPYSTLNLTAAVDKKQKHHFGTNAIEFSDLDGDCDGADPLFAKFYTYKADPGNASVDETRLHKIDLDGRGEKFMPGTCIICHGGTSRPLLTDGTYASAALPGAGVIEIAQRVGDTNAKLQPLEVDTLEFSDQPGFTLNDQETKLKQFNQIIYRTFETMNNSVDGEWKADFIIDVMNGWYNGDINNPAFTSFDGSYVPPGWQPDLSDNNPPAGTDELFVKVIKPYCLSCHSKRGSNLGLSLDPINSQDIDFSSYAEFVTYSSQIEDFVYDRGIMPLSRLNYEKFWDSDAPEILASFIPNFSHGDANGLIHKPGKPVAKTGPDRTTPSPVNLSAASSLFANTYNWSITASPTGSNPVINDSTGIQAIFTTDIDGSYELSLTVGNGTETSTINKLNLIIDSASSTPGDITFDADIAPILSVNCAPACHQAGGITGVPLYYDTPSNSQSIYENVRQRINFSTPEDSLLTLKPTGNHHFGAAPLGGNDYNTFVNWILEGAREN